MWNDDRTRFAGILIQVFALFLQSAIFTYNSIDENSSRSESGLQLCERLTEGQRRRLSIERRISIEFHGWSCLLPTEFVSQLSIFETNILLRMPPHRGNRETESKDIVVLFVHRMFHGCFSISLSLKNLKEPFRACK